MGIEKYHQELYMAVEQLHELKTAAEFADEYYRVRLNAFSEGLASSTDVTDDRWLLPRSELSSFRLSTIMILLWHGF